MKKTQESGRSMVEMLGVLAIIGVLSVGGIAGYTLAMNRFRANEVIDMANKFAVVAFSARETYAAMHNGNSNGFTPPTLANSGLGGGASNVNGATFGAVTYHTDTTCGTAADNSTTALSIQIPITFPAGLENVCKAVASTLGVNNACAANATINFCSRNS